MRFYVVSAYYNSFGELFGVFGAYKSHYFNEEFIKGIKSAKEKTGEWMILKLFRENGVTEYQCILVAENEDIALEIGIEEINKYMKFENGV